MSQFRPPSDEALQAKREEFDDSRQDLIAELEQVTLELSNAEGPSDSESENGNENESEIESDSDSNSDSDSDIDSDSDSDSDSDPKKILPKILKQLKDTSSSKLRIIKLLTDKIRNPQEAERIKQGNTEQKITKFCSTLSQLYRLYFAAITQQARRVRSLYQDRTSCLLSVLEEAEERLETLKAEYLSDTGEEWSDVREEGPIILTRNPVKGLEISPELEDIVKQLKSDGAMRY